MEHCMAMKSFPKQCKKLRTKVYALVLFLWYNKSNIYNIYDLTYYKWGDENVSTIACGF